MAFYTSDTALDATLEVIATCTRMDAVTDSTAPTDLTNSVGNVTLTAGDGNGDWTIGDGDTSGRKITLGAQSIPVTANGTVRHYVFSLSGTIHHVSECSEQVTYTGNTLSVAAFDVFENRDPAAE